MPASLLENPLIYLQRNKITKRFRSMLVTIFALYALALLHYLLTNSDVAIQLANILIVIGGVLLPFLIFYLTLENGRSLLSHRREELKASTLTHLELYIGMASHYTVPWLLAILLAGIIFCPIAVLLPADIGIPLSSLESKECFFVFVSVIKFISHCFLTTTVATIALNLEHLTRREYSTINYFIAFILFAIAGGLIIEGLQDIYYQSQYYDYGEELRYLLKDLPESLFESFLLPWQLYSRSFIYHTPTNRLPYFLAPPCLWSMCMVAMYYCSHKLFDNKGLNIIAPLTNSFQRLGSWRKGLLTRLWHNPVFLFCGSTLLSIFIATLAFTDIIDSEFITVLFVGLLWLLPPLRATRILHTELSRERWENLMVTQLSREEVLKAQFWKGCRSILAFMVPMAGTVILISLPDPSPAYYCSTLIFFCFSVFTYYLIAFGIQLYFLPKKTDLKLIVGWVLLHAVSLFLLFEVTDIDHNTVFSILPAFSPFRLLESPYYYATDELYTICSELCYGALFWFLVGLFTLFCGHTWTTLKEVHD